MEVVVPETAEALAAADDHSMSTRLGIIIVLLMAGILIIRGVVSVKNSDLIQKLPGNVFGVFVWKKNTPLHKEMVRRFGDLSIDGMLLGKTFAHDARRFAFVFYENPWRVSLFAEGDKSYTPQKEPRLVAQSRAALRAALISNDGALVSPRFQNARAVSMGMIENRIAARFKDTTTHIPPAFPHTQNDVAYISTSKEVVTALVPLFQKIVPLVFEKLPPLPEPLPDVSVTCALEDASRWLCGVAAENRADIESWESVGRALAQKLTSTDETTSKTILLPDGEIAREARESADWHQSKPYFVWQNDAYSFVFGTTVMEPRSTEGWSYGCTPEIQGEPFLFIDINQLDEMVNNLLISSIKPMVSDVIMGIYRQNGTIICF